MSDLLSLDATGQIAALESKRIGAVELLEASVARCEAVNPALNAVVAMDLDRARARALAIDDHRARGDQLGSLAGLPMTVKDTFDVEGLPASSGLEAFRRGRRPDALAGLFRGIETLRDVVDCSLVEHGVLPKDCS